MKQVSSSWSTFIQTSNIVLYISYVTPEANAACAKRGISAVVPPPWPTCCFAWPEHAHLHGARLPARRRNSTSDREQTAIAHAHRKSNSTKDEIATIDLRCRHKHLIVLVQTIRLKPRNYAATIDLRRSVIQTFYLDYSHCAKRYCR